jgi:hypothetical protein
LRSQERLSILCLYAQSQTYTQTVFEHVEALGKYSLHDWAYLDYGLLNQPGLDLNAFDAVVIHYSVRLPYGQIDDRGADKLEGYSGLKVLFIQDEYDHTNRAKSLIRKIGCHLVFSVVPPRHLESIYPAAEFPNVVFVSNFTGYVPADLVALVGATKPPSARNLVVGYRGRPLPLRYGQLGREKVEIGRLVKEYCDAQSIPNDIAWSEEARIYGTRWYGFLASCRAMLGSESGSNVFDWDGSLDARIGDYRRANPLASDAEVYQQVVLPQERPGLMNQISPRLFEAIASKTVLVLFEGEYSDVVKPGEHYIAVRKDGSNLDEVFSLLRDDHYIDRMVQHTHSEIIGSGKYSYRSFVGLVDARINELFAQKGAAVPAHRRPGYPRMVMTNMAMSRSPLRPRKSSSTIKWILQVVFFPVRPLWRSMPEFLKRLIRPVIKKIFY